MNHERHDHCEHTVKVCQHCDVAYCTICKKEWGKPCTLNHYPMVWYNGTNTWQATRPYVFGSTTAGGSIPTTSTVTGSLSHAHN